MRYRIVLACALSALTLADCAGQPRGGALPAQLPSGASQHVRGRAKIGLRLTIPRRRKRGAKYVSPSTKSIVVAEGAAKLGTFDTSGSSSSCRSSNGSTVCQFSLAISAGANQTFTVSAYDAANGTGKLLSSGSVTQTIGPGYNPILVTLSGAIASIAVAVQNPNAPAGTAATLPLTVMAKDADGNVIVGPGNYSSQITLTDSDASGITALSATKVDGPASSVSLIYNGKSIGSASIGASAAGVSNANVTAGVFAPAPSVVADYALPLGPGNVPLQPASIASGTDGNLYLGVYGTSCCALAGIVKMTTGGQTTYYQNGVAPSTNLPAARFNGLAWGSDGNLWYASSSSIGKMTTAGVATDFPLSGGSMCSGAKGWRIVPAADGGLWATVSCTSGTQLVHVTTGGTLTPYDVPGLEYVNGLTIGQDGNVYLGGENSGTGNPAVAQAVVSGSTIASTSLADVPGAGSGNSITGVMAAPNGDLWLTNDACTTSTVSRLHVATPFASSVAASYTTPNACEDGAYGVALADGSIWYANGNFPSVTHVVPGAYPAAPALTDMSLMSAVQGYEWDMTVGPDGFMYVSNWDYATGLSGDVAKFAY
jgi:hypothetical protein